MRAQRRMVITGIVGVLALLLGLTMAVVAPKVLFTLSTQDYSAEFANAAGLVTGDQVSVAGVPAGRVTDVTLAGDRVRVAFRLDNGQQLGTATTASIKLATVLGKRFLAVQPAGSGRSETIPLSRTAVPYSLDELAGEATATASQLDTASLQKLITTLAGVAPRDPTLVGNALKGITSATKIIADHNGQFTQLLSGAKSVTSALLDQQDTLVKLLGDADLVVQTLNSRRHVIQQLITDVSSLSTQLTTFLRDNKDVLDPLLDNVHTLTSTLASNDKALSDTISLFAPATRYLTNATGNGPWTDVSGPAAIIPDNVLCVAGLLKGCR